jgi:hypothetical protein
MSADLGPIDIVCDAPPYPVVRACEKHTFRSPADVRWARLERPAGNGSGELPALPGRGPACSCGQPMPSLEVCTFIFFVTGKHVSYFLGQCRRCGTMFWENA